MLHNQNHVRHQRMVLGTEMKILSFITNLAVLEVSAFNYA